MSGKVNGKGEIKYGKRKIDIQASEKLDVSFVLEAHLT